MSLSISAPKSNAAWYALRRTLPTWSFSENLAELVRCLERYGVDELIVKTDTEEFTHGQPPLEWVRAYRKNLFEIKRAMDKLGIVYSLNPWITVGHCDRGRDSRKMIPGLVTMVGHDGVKTTCCACPLSKAWRNHVEKVWTIYAETKPHVIWIEDDIRTFNHSPVEFGCFCREHMKLFSKRVGRKVTREELVAAILKPGKPHRWRAEYFDMQYEVMTDTVAFLAGVVHRTSPETSLGLMSSGPNSHCIDGRRWDEFASALADGKPLYSRPPMGNYSESSLRGFYYSHDSIKITRHCLPADVIEQTEVESVPFTKYSKSINATFLQMALSFAYGSHGVTLNLYDHCGSPLEDTPDFGRLLEEKKRYLNALANRCTRPGIYRGVRLLFHEKQSYRKVLRKDAQYANLRGDGHPIMEALESHGVPTTYDDSEVATVCGQTLRALGDKEIRALLSRGVMLDGEAAFTLFERGYGAEIGLRSIQKPRFLDDIGVFSAEELYNNDFGGARHRYLTLTLPDLGGRPDFAVMTPCKSARIISRLVDPDAARHHAAMYAFENKLGGRVVVGGIVMSTAFGPAYCNPYRLKLLQETFRWLARGKPPIFVRGGVYPLSFRKDCEGYTVIGLFNLSLDPWESAEFEIADKRRIKKIDVLSTGGVWRKDKAFTSSSKAGIIKLNYKGEIPFDRPLFATVHWKDG